MRFKKGTLLENSELYYNMNHVYEIFSKAEDALGLVEDYLISKAKGKTILDLGCGTGKFLVPLSRVSRKYIGLDVSQDQIDVALGKDADAELICSSAENIPLEDESVDIIISAWAIGTILEESRRMKVLEEIERVLKEGGICYFIENANEGEFERLRGRLRPGDNRTRDYNNFLLRNFFKEVKRFETYFKFESEYQANKVFRRIWGDSLIGDVVGDRVGHAISIFRYKKDRTNN